MSTIARYVIDNGNQLVGLLGLVEDPMDPQGLSVYTLPLCLPVPCHNAS